MADSSVAQERSSFYVYVIFRPDGTPCYVGKGHGRRADHHRRFTKNRHLRNLFAKYGDLPIARVREHLTDAEACSTEIALIAAIGRRDLGTGPLINLTIGGDGAAGHIKTLETRAKLSASRKGMKFPPEWVEAMRASRLGKKRDPASRAKQAATITGRTRPEHSAALKGRPNPKNRDHQLGRKSPEHSARMAGNKLSLGKNLGNRNSQKYPEEMILEIFRRAWTGESLRSIAKDFNIVPEYVSSIKRAKVWKSLLLPLMQS